MSWRFHFESLWPPRNPETINTVTTNYDSYRVDEPNNIRILRWGAGGAGPPADRHVAVPQGPVMKSLSAEPPLNAKLLIKSSVKFSLLSAGKPADSIQ